MPTITVHQADLEALLGAPFSAEVFEDQLALVKGELDDFDPATGELRVELNDTNRPDLWCVEGITRQISQHQQGKGRDYPFFARTDASREVVVDASVSGVRPFIGACIARGVTVDERLLTQLIQTQEKICDVFGHKRKSIAIGIYSAKKLRFPLSYAAVSPDGDTFVPLGMDEPLTLSQVVEMHPKGQEFGHIVADYGYWPLLKDAAGTVLSFPPVINSRAVGEVKVGDSELFLEVTGTNQRMVSLVINLLAVNMADRGAEIEPVRVRYPEATEFGDAVITPMPLARQVPVAMAAFEAALGDPFSVADVDARLTAYGFTVSQQADAVTVSAPHYRDDILHPVDVIEDFAISRGYDQFDPIMPVDFTVGSLTETERTADQVRDYLVGLGFQEILSNILVNREELTDDMGLHGASLVAVSNPMSASYSVLRNAVLPSLLRVEKESGNAFYPHMLFESGQVAIPSADEPMGSVTRTQVAGLLSHPSANFSELAARLEMLFYYMNIDHQLEPVDHASYIPGRAGRILYKGKNIGMIGELSPQVLENWGISVPCAAFEIDLMALLPH